MVEEKASGPVRVVLNHLCRAGGTQHPDNQKIAGSCRREDETGKQKPLEVGKNSEKGRANAQEDCGGQCADAVGIHPEWFRTMRKRGHGCPMYAKGDGGKGFPSVEGPCRRVEQFVQHNSPPSMDRRITGFRKSPTACATAPQPFTSTNKPPKNSTGTMATGIASTFTCVMDMVTSRAFGGIGDVSWFISVVCFDQWTTCTPVHIR